MFKKKSTPTGNSIPAMPVASGESSACEVRPCGMLVQQRNSDQSQSVIVPKIKVCVKYGSSKHEIAIIPHASFGELKKIMEERTGLHPEDQKMMYKDKERDSKSFLDILGVKNGSKIVVIEDNSKRARRLLELRQTQMMEKSSKAVSEIRIEIDKLAKQVASLEAEIYRGKKTEDGVLSSLIELLMTKLLKLDEIVGDGDVKLQRKEQVRRVQKYIETLDMLKVKNSKLEVKRPFIPIQQKHQIPIPVPNNVEQQRKQRNAACHVPRKSTVTTNWESFDSSAPSSEEFKYRYSYTNSPSQFAYGKPAEFFWSKN